MTDEARAIDLHEQIRRLRVVQMADARSNAGLQRLGIRAVLQRIEIVVALDPERVAVAEPGLHVRGHVARVREQAEPLAARAQAVLHRVVHDESPPRPPSARIVLRADPPYASLTARVRVAPAASSHSPAAQAAAPAEQAARSAT